MSEPRWRQSSFFLSDAAVRLIAAGAPMPRMAGDGVRALLADFRRTEDELTGLAVSATRSRPGRPDDWTITLDCTGSAGFPKRYPLGDPEPPAHVVTFLEQLRMYADEEIAFQAAHQ